MNTPSVHTQFPQPKMLSPVRNKLEEIIYEGIMQRRQLLIENNNDVWPANVDTKWTNNRPAEKFLKSIGAVPYNYGSNDVKLAASAFYEITYNTTYIPNLLFNPASKPITQGQDSFMINSKPVSYKSTWRFYPDNTVKDLTGGINPMTQKPAGMPRLLGWKFAGNNIKLYAEPGEYDEDGLRGTVKNVGGKPSVVMTAAAVKTAKTFKRGTDDFDGKAFIRIVLDLVGWVPFYGEIADLINGAWYLYDYSETGSLWDLAFALLSFLGAVPLVGSFISSGGKLTMAGIKQAKNISMLRGNMVSQILEKIFKLHKPNHTQLELLKAGYHPMVTNFGKLKVALHGKLGDAFEDALDAAEAELKAGENAIDDLITQAKRTKNIKAGKGPKIKPAGGSSEETAALKNMDARGIKWNKKTGKYDIKDKTALRNWQYSETNRILKSASSLTYAERGEAIVRLLKSNAPKWSTRSLSKLQAFLKSVFTYSIDKKSMELVITRIGRIFENALKSNPDRLVIVIKTGVKGLENILKFSAKELEEVGPILIKQFGKSKYFADEFAQYLSKMKAIQQQISQLGSNAVKKSNPAAFNEYTEYSKNIFGAKHDFLKNKYSSKGVAELVKNFNSSEAIKFFDELKRVNKNIYERIAVRISDAAKLNDNPAWNLLLSNPGTQLKAYGILDRNTISAWAPSIDNISKFVAKWLLSEGRELGYQLHLTNEGTARGFIMKALGEAMIDKWSFLKDLRDEAMATINANTPDRTSDDEFIIPASTNATASDNTAVRPSSRPRSRSINSFGAEK